MTFYIVNRERGTTLKRLAIVYAKDEAEARKKLLAKFVTAVDIQFYKDNTLIDPTLSACVIK